jgi:DNA adenine methylase
MDARFERRPLAHRIEYIADFRHRVSVTQLDAREFLATLEPFATEHLVYVDPPYITQGDDLYLDRLSYADHQAIASQLMSSNLRWFMTYDVDERITDELYPNLRCAVFNIKHTAHYQHVGSEYAVYSDSLAVPNLDIMRQDKGQWVVN